MALLAIPLLFFLQAAIMVVVQSATFTLVNKCDGTVWPGVLSGAGSLPMGPTGFELPAGSSRALRAPSGWSGRMWGRTGCSFDSSGRGNCTSGDCGSAQVECNGAGAAPPATLAEFTLAGADGKDFYDVSLVDGYNIPMLVEAIGGNGSCAATGCAADLNQRCPAELKSAEGDGCRSACEAFGKPEYCCSGEYGNPNTCQPSVYSQLFKSACPRSYSFAYDDATSTFTCTDADYTVTFCPPAIPSRISTVPSPPRGVFIQDDSWLASMAMGDASPMMMQRTALFLRHMSLIIITNICVLLLYL
ncbi:thaumatin-like protein 1b [Iris pallida]|uniref:Thaumatin-like protein 1b n=1 Tax=Iris pallida TaxID=29817 RepID=A0AAX6G0R8_IRIPA|nr:thaumatin-like protein 1b [Iris pallida]